MPPPPASMAGLAWGWPSATGLPGSGGGPLPLQTQKWGLVPRETESPRQALEWVARGDPFDAAILDMHMPEMDGLALAAELRRLRPAAALPLVLFTSLGRREAGADGLD